MYNHCYYLLQQTQQCCLKGKMLCVMCYKKPTNVVFQIHYVFSAWTMISVSVSNLKLKHNQHKLIYFSAVFMETSSSLLSLSLSLSWRLWTPPLLVWQFDHETKHEQAQINKWETPGHKCLMSPESTPCCCDDERGKHTITSATSFSL